MKTFDLYQEMKRLRIEARRAREAAREDERRASEAKAAAVVAPDPREGRRQAVLDAARKLGSTLRESFTLADIARETGASVKSVAGYVMLLRRDGRWPYRTVEPGVYRDPRPWFERIAIEMSAT